MIEKASVAGKSAKSSRTISLRFQLDLLINIIFAVVNLLGVFLLTRVSTAYLAPTAFGLFMLVRRYSTGISTFADLGGSIAQFRYQGMFAGEKRMSQMVSISVLCFFLLVSTILAAIAYLGSPFLSHLLLPNNENAHWVLGYSVGLGIQNLLLFNLINNLLQERRMILYNVVRVMNGFGIFLLIFFLSKSPSVRQVLWRYLILGDLMAVVGLVYYNLLPLLRWREFPWARFGWVVREVFTYGFMRSFVAFLSAAIFVVGPWLIRDDLREVGYLSTIYLFLLTMGLIIQPINQISMIVSARNLAPGQDEKFHMGIRFLFGCIFIASILFSVALYPWLDAFFRLVVSSDEIAAGVRQYSILMICVIPLSLFNGLRGVIDMRWKRPYNLYNLLAGHLLGLVAFFVLRLNYTLAVCVIGYTLVAFWTLGILTVYTMRNFLSGMHWHDMGTFTAVAMLALVANLLIRAYLLPNPIPVPVQLLFVSLTGLVLPFLWWVIFRPVFLRDLLTEAGWQRL